MRQRVRRLRHRVSLKRLQVDALRLLANVVRAAVIAGCHLVILRRYQVIAVRQLATVARHLVIVARRRKALPTGRLG